MLKNNIAIILAALMMLGFASCVGADRNRTDNPVYSAQPAETIDGIYY